MARFLCSIVPCLFLLLSCAPGTGPGASTPVQESTPEGRIVEQAILWDGKLDAGMDSVAMKELVADKERFENQGMSYLCLKPIVVFGHRAAYVSYLGVGSLAGPNAVLKGTPKSVAAAVSRRSGAVFQSKEGIYLSDYKPTVRILIQEHPELEGAVIVLGAYNGPR